MCAALSNKDIEAAACYVRIEESTKGLVVTIPAKRSSAMQTVLISVSSLLVFGFFALGIGNVGSSQYPLFAKLLFATLGALTLFETARSLGGQHQVLRADSQSFTLDRFEFGRIWKSNTFARCDVSKVEFGAVGYTRYGAITGLIFTVDGKNHKSLPGLRVIEADRILKILSSLNYAVAFDPGMAMMLEMAASHRKSKFSRWFTH